MRRLHSLPDIVLPKWLSVCAHQVAVLQKASFAQGKRTVTLATANCINGGGAKKLENTSARTHTKCERIYGIKTSVYALARAGDTVSHGNKCRIGLTLRFRRPAMFLVIFSLALFHAGGGINLGESGTGQRFPRMHPPCPDTTTRVVFFAFLDHLPRLDSVVEETCLFTRLCSKTIQCRRPARRKLSR